jgi:phospholipid transport system transporter-binding protein
MLTLPETVRLGNAESVLSALTKGMQGRPAKVGLQLDASALRDFDSAVLAVVLECKRRALALGHAIELVGAPAKLEDLARVYGLTALLWPERASGA